MFIEPSRIGEIFVRIEPVDFRRGLVGFCSTVSESFADERGRARLFVFTNRTRKLLRIVYWDDTGYAYWHKALEADRFKWPKSSTGDRVVTQEQLLWLLSGIDIDSVKKHRSSAAKSFV